MSHSVTSLKIVWIISLVSVLLLPCVTMAQDEGEAGPRTEIFEDWSLRCQNVDETSAQKKPCQLIQSASASEAMEDVFLLSIALAEDVSIATAVVTLPLGVYLANDIQIYVDGRQAFVLRYEICDQRACYAGFKMQEGLVSSWERGIEARFRVWTGRDKAVEFPVSLRGFKTAWAAFQGVPFNR